MHVVAGWAADPGSAAGRTSAGQLAYEAAGSLLRGMEKGSPQARTPKPQDGE